MTPLQVRFSPPQVTVPPGRPGDPRVGHLLGRAVGGGAPRVVLIGFGVDEGVRRNGGRPGAAGAPGRIREALYRLTPDGADPGPFGALIERTVDRGDLEVTGDLEHDQQLLGAAVAAELRRGTIPIVLGGGHETTFGHFLGWVEVERPVRVVNLDAHADVRELSDGRGHSGSPFRQVLEHPSKRCSRYSVLGLLPHAVSAAHLEYVRQHGGEVCFRGDLSWDRLERLLSGREGESLFSFDIDAVDQGAAPGVSAPGAGGLPVDLWLHAAWLAGASPGGRSYDLVEVNPAFDQDSRTARLAALTIWQILRGIASRERRRPVLGFARA